MAKKKSTLSPRALFLIFLIVAFGLTSLIYSQVFRPRADISPSLPGLTTASPTATSSPGATPNPVAQKRFRGELQNLDGDRLFKFYRLIGQDGLTYTVRPVTQRATTRLRELVGQRVEITGRVKERDKEGLWLIRAYDARALPPRPTPTPTPTRSTSCRTSLELVYVLDRSGSMDDGFPPQPDALVRTFVREAEDEFRPNDRVALVTFARPSRVEIGYTDPAAVTAKVRAIRFGAGSSDLGEGVQTTSDYMRQNLSERGRVIIILTDGRRLGGISQAKNITARDFEDQQVRTRAYVVALKNNVPQLRNLAGGAGGLYARVNNGTQINRAIDAIFNKITDDLACKLSGAKFNDRNGNGQRESDEPGLGGWTIELLRADAQGVFEKVGETVTQGEAQPNRPVGFFSFANLLPGQYRLRELLEPGWELKTPDVESTTFTMPGEVTNVLFGNKQINPLDFTLSLEATPLNIRHGDTVGLKFRYQNRSNQPARNADIFQSLPPGLTDLADGDSLVQVHVGDVPAGGSGEKTHNVRVRER